jgi:hypothetical protein
MSELFPGKDFGRPRHAATAPVRATIGHKNRRAATVRKLSPVQLLLGELQQLSLSFAQLGKRLQLLEAEIARTTQDRRQIREALDRLLRAQVETRRALGQTELHRVPIHTRRRPLSTAIKNRKAPPCHHGFCYQMRCGGSASSSATLSDGSRSELLRASPATSGNCPSAVWCQRRRPFRYRLRKCRPK